MQEFISIAVLLLLIIVGPILTILSLNTLFSLTIPITIWTWLSTAWLCSFIVYKGVKND